MKLSMVIPCYNEAENVTAFYNAAITAFDGCGYDFELVFVDDGSRDATLHNLKKLHASRKCPMQVISFSRNFGKEAAIYAGLQQARGEYITLIDADLQQHPSIARQMVQILDSQPQTDIVAAYQDRRGEGKVLSFFKKCFYSLINRLSDVELHADASDFRTFRCSVAESLLQLGEYHRFSKGLFSWVGYSTQFIPYTAQPRTSGKTKWSFRKLLNYGIDGIVGFSTRPLRISTYLGFFTAAAAMIYLVVVILEKLIFGINIPGYATTIVLTLFLGGVQLLCIGIIGEYVGNIYEQSKQRPIYIAKEILKDE